MHLLFRPGWILDYLHVIYLGSMVLGALAIFIPAFTARARTRAEEDASVLVM
jgi:anti-anti-sigma regulatory factor